MADDSSQNQNNTSKEGDEKAADGALTVEYSAIKGTKILIVEDDRFLHSLIGDKLSKAEAELTAAFDGETGLEKARAESPDIILLDILLPGIDGFEVLRQLKEDPELKDTPVIILSNLGQESDIKKGTELGAEEFLIKANFTLEDILTKINEVLSGKGGTTAKDD